MRRFTTLVCSIVLASSVTSAAAAPAEAPTARLQPWLAEVLAGSPVDQLAVAVHAADANHLADARAAVTAVGMQELFAFDAVGVVIARATPAQVEQVRHESGVVYVEGDRPIVQALDTSHMSTRADIAIRPDVFDTSMSTGGANDGSGSRFDGTGHTIAIVDGGIDGLHPMFMDPVTRRSKVVRNLENICPFNLDGTIPSEDIAATCFVDDPTNNTDGNSAGGHGTHVAGIAAGYEVVDLAGRKLRGAAPGAMLIGISTGGANRIFGSANTLNWILENHENPCAGNPYGGTVYPNVCPPITATNHSYSYGSGNFDENAVDVKLGRLLIAEGIVMSYSANNDGGDGSVPLTNTFAGDQVNGVLMVANYDDQRTGTRDGRLNNGSSRGQDGKLPTYPDISAPGTQILSACLPQLPICKGAEDGDPVFYDEITGTSMASPHIAGYVTVLQQADPTLTPAQIEDILEDTAHKFTIGAPYEPDDPARNDDNTTSYDKGHGLVDLAAALAEVLGVPVPDVAPACPPVGPHITDVRGDGRVYFGAGDAGLAPGLDVLSVAISADDNANVTFVMELDDLVTTPSGYPEFYRIYFEFDGRPYDVQATRAATGAVSFSLADYVSPTSGGSLTRRVLGALTGTLDVATDLVTIVLPADAMASSVAAAPILKAGDLLVGIHSTTRYDTTAYVRTADGAAGPCPFVIGPPGQVDLPSLRVGDVTVDEGDDGATDAVFTISRDGPSTGDVIVEVTTTDMTATSPGDYTALPSSTTVTLTDGVTSVPVTVTVNGDVEVEADETFRVDLANPTGATIGDGSAVGTITDDDDTTPPTIAISNAVVVEASNGETSDLNFLVTLSEPATDTVTVQFSTTTGPDDDATSDADYDAVIARNVTFSPGQDAKLVAVTVRGDDVTEADETLTGVLATPVGATISNAVARGTIEDDDIPELTVADVRVNERDGVATIVVTLSQPSPRPVRVDHITAAGSATSPEDYRSTSGTTVFSVGATTQTVSVTLVDDETVEPTESFELRLSSPVGAVITDDAAVVTITDDDRTSSPRPTPTPTPTLSPTPTPSASPSPATRDRVDRLAGDDRYATAVAVSRSNFPVAGSATTAVLALGTDPDRPDALVGAPLAAALNAPLLLVTSLTVPGPTREELLRVLRADAEVVVIGGLNAVGAEAEAQLRGLGLRVRRIAGTSRYDTATLVAAELGHPDELFVTTGERFPDALSAGAAAAARGGAVLLTTNDSPSPATAAYLAAHPSASAWAIGGPAVRAFPGLEAVTGADRQATAVAVARRFLPEATTLAFARADLPFDALTAGAYIGGELGAPILLTSVPAATIVAAYTCEVADIVHRAVVLGGPAALASSLDDVLLARIEGREC